MQSVFAEPLTKHRRLIPIPPSKVRQNGDRPGTLWILVSRIMHLLEEGGMAGHNGFGILRRREQHVHSIQAYRFLPCSKLVFGIFYFYLITN